MNLSPTIIYISLLGEILTATINFNFAKSFANLDALLVISFCIASTLAYAFCNLTSYSIFSSSQSYYPAVYGLLFFNSSLSSATKLSSMLISFLYLSTSPESVILRVLCFKHYCNSIFSVLNFSNSSMPSLAL